MTPSRRQTAGMTGSSPYVTPAPRSRIGDMSHVRFTQRVVIHQPGRNTRRQVALIAYVDIISARVASGKQPRFRNRLNDPPTKKYNTHKSPNARNKGRLTPGRCGSKDATVPYVVYAPSRHSRTQKNIDLAPSYKR